MRKGLFLYHMEQNTENIWPYFHKRDFFLLSNHWNGYTRTFISGKISVEQKPWTGKRQSCDSEYPELSVIWETRTVPIHRRRLKETLVLVN